MDAEHISPAFAAAAPAELIRALEQDSGTVYAIDEGNRIVFVNPAWYTFAAANGGERLIRSPILGLSLRSVVPDILQRFYDAGFAHAWASGQVWEHEYECSSDTVFRRFRMRALPLPPGRFAVISNDLIREERRALPGSSIDSTYRSETGLVLQCAHCRRVRLAVTDTWHWVPKLVSDPPAHVSHGLCSSCLEYHYPA